MPPRRTPAQTGGLATLTEALEAAYANAGVTRMLSTPSPTYGGLTSGAAMRAQNPLSGLEAWLPNPSPMPFPGLQGWDSVERVLRDSPLLSAIPRVSQRPQRPGRLYTVSRYSRHSRHVMPDHDPVGPMVPRLLAGITRSILEGNAEMPQERLSGVRTGRTRSIAEALQEAVQEVSREGLRPSTLVVHPSLMGRVYQELAFDRSLVGLTVQPTDPTAEWPSFAITGGLTIQSAGHPIDVVLDRSLPDGSAYLVDPSHLAMVHGGSSPITVSQNHTVEDEIEVRLAYTAQVIATHHAAITQLMIEAVEPAVTNNVLPSRTAWDRLMDDDFLGEAA